MRHLCAICRRPLVDCMADRVAPWAGCPSAPPDGGRGMVLAVGGNPDRSAPRAPLWGIPPDASSGVPSPSAPPLSAEAPMPSAPPPPPTREDSLPRPSIRMGTRSLRRSALGTPPPVPEGSTRRSPTRGVRGPPARACEPRSGGRRSGGGRGTTGSTSGRGRVTHPPAVAPEVPPTGRVRQVRIRVRRESPAAGDVSPGEGPSRRGSWPPPSSSEASALTSEEASDSPDSSQAPQSEAPVTTSSSDSRTSGGEEEEWWTVSSGSGADEEEDGESGSPREFSSSLSPPVWVMILVKFHMGRPSLSRFWPLALVDLGRVAPLLTH